MGLTGNSSANCPAPAGGNLKRYGQDGCNNEKHGDHGDTSLSLAQPIKNPPYTEKAGRTHLASYTSTAPLPVPGR